MRERSAFPRRLAWMLAVVALSPALHARGLDPTDLPTRYLGHGVDRGLVTVASPTDGRVWSAWSYRSGSESDIAISVRDSLGFWSEPVFLGSASGRDEVDPALVFDPAGNLYLAHSVRETGQILVSMLSAGATRMSSPILVSAAGERAAAPTLMLTDNHLMVGYRVGPRVLLRSIPITPAHRPFAVQDGPDGFPPAHNGSSDEEGSTSGVGV